MTYLPSGLESLFYLLFLLFVILLYKFFFIFLVKKKHLISRNENETLQEAFDRTEKPGSRKDYLTLFVVGVSVKDHSGLSC
jgi:hypothetical protein